MTAKRALVVDDSRSARISLQKLLQKYGIGVDFAESGEEALDYLKHHVADAIFMDHTMPGMDGLETVVAIKSNPRTATIPVMMYTANEGEVYVGQARALGALGVLPKQVQPGVLEGMLERLGLLQPLAEPLSARPAAPAIFAGGVPGSPPAGALDPTAAAVDTRTAVQAARIPESAPSSQPDPPEQGGAEQVVATPSPVLQQAVAPAPHTEHSGFSGRDAIARAEAEPEAQALAMTLQAVVERTLAEQHVRLRADILRSHREIGHQVAEEVLAGVEAAQAAADDDSGVASAEQTVIGPAPRRPSVVAWVLLIALSLVAAALWRERVDLVSERDRLAAAVDLRDDEMARLRRPVDGADAAPRNGADGAIPERRVLATLAWALARDNRIGFDEQAFDDRRASDLEALLRELQAIGFRGTVRLESHLGTFCLIEGTDGQWTEAPHAAPLDACQRFGHPRDGSVTEASEQSVGFASLLLQVPRLTDDLIRVELVARERPEADAPETLAGGAADGVLTAGDWNELARRNQRVSVTLLPARS